MREATLKRQSPSVLYEEEDEKGESEWQTRVQQGTCMNQEGVGGAKCARSTNRLNEDSRGGPRNLDIFR